LLGLETLAEVRVVDLQVVQQTPRVKLRSAEVCHASSASTPCSAASSLKR
jgi:hypothetical protein